MTGCYDITCCDIRKWHGIIPQIFLSKPSIEMQTHLLHTDQLGDDASRFAEQPLFGTLKKINQLNMMGSMVWAQGELSSLFFKIAKEDTWDRSKDGPKVLTACRFAVPRVLTGSLTKSIATWESEKQCKNLVMTSNRYEYSMVEPKAAKKPKKRKMPWTPWSLHLAASLASCEIKLPSELSLQP